MTAKKVGGARPGAGRPLGAATLKTRQVADEAAKKGITPLEVFLERLRFHYDRYEDERAKPKPKIELMAKELAEASEAGRDAAPFIHPKLSSIDFQGNVSMTHEMALRQLTEDEEAEAETAKPKRKPAKKAR